MNSCEELDFVNLCKFINDNLIIDDENKKLYGEVFTPIKIIDEILDNLNSHYLSKYKKSIFSNPHLKWFDPAAGIGNFLLIIYLRLFDGLKFVIKDKVKRHYHIVENMLYYAEFNKANCNKYKQIIKSITSWLLNKNKNKPIKLNAYCGDSLKLNIAQAFNIEKFDIVIGNPPYQDNSGNKGNNLWTKFVIKSLNECEWLAFIHPPLWRSPNHKMNILFNYKIYYLSMNDLLAGKRDFKSSIKYDWYILETTQSNKTHLTRIKDYDDKLSYLPLYKLNYLPSGEFDKIFNLLKGKDKLEIIHSESLYIPRKPYIKKESSKVYNKPVVHGVNKSGLNLYYSDRNIGHYGVPKVIFSTCSLIDEEGKYALTQNVSAIVDKKENLQKIKNALDNEDFQNLLKRYMRITLQSMDFKIFKLIRKDFYKLFV